MASRSVSNHGAPRRLAGSRGQPVSQRVEKFERVLLEDLNAGQSGDLVDVDLLIEGHGRFDVQTACLLAQELLEFKPFWFEEPLPPETFDSKE